MRWLRRGLGVGAALLLLTSCASGENAASPAPSVTATGTQEAVVLGPAPTDWLADLEADATGVYVTSHDCPGLVAAGLCTIKGDLPGPLKAYPIRLWHYGAEGWRDLGEPGVFSYSTLHVARGGLVLVPLLDSPSSGAGATGPLRVSTDGGASWVDWEIPDQQRRCRGTCRVVTAGEHVVVASSAGWVRRDLGSSDWQDVTPPARGAVEKFDELGYGALGLDDGTLVATVNPLDPDADGFYLVSKDGGATWGPRHPVPGEQSQVDSTDGTTVYATCWKVDKRSSSGTSGSQCPMYTSTDLVHWGQSTLYEPAQCRRDLGPAVPGWRETALSVQAGRVVYAITNVPYVNGREAQRKDLPHLDAPHRRAHVLEVSADGCKTWTEVPRAGR